MPKISLLSPQMCKVMQALSRYRYLTVYQMLSLGISKNDKSLRDKTLGGLRHHKCIESVKVGSFMPDVHYLTKQGWELLVDFDDGCRALPPCKKKQPFSALYIPHRLAQIDFHIGFIQWAESRGDMEIELECQDFIRQPKHQTVLNLPNGEGKIIPDGTFAVSSFAGQSALYLVEIHRTTQTKAIVEQLSQYFSIIRTGIAEQKYKIDAHPIICSVHCEPAVLKAVKQRLLKHQDFAVFRFNFVFRHFDNLRSNFCTGWHFADDSPAHPFPSKS